VDGLGRDVPDMNMKWLPPADVNAMRLLFFLSKLNIDKTEYAEGDVFIDYSTNKLHMFFKGILVEVATVEAGMGM